MPEEQPHHYERQPPEFSIVFKGGVMEPLADVAPEGEVRFVLINESATAHDFAVVNLDRRSHEERGRRVEETEPGVVACVDQVPPGGSRSVTYHLERGRYMLVTNTPGEQVGIRLFDVTVQPVEG